MRLNAGIITEKLVESKTFYSQLLGFGVTFENEFYALMHTPDQQTEVSFLLANHESQPSLFHKAFNGEGVFLTIEVDDVDTLYEQFKQKGVAIKMELKDEPWGDRHFVIQDPNGVSIDIVKYTPSSAEPTG